MSRQGVLARLRQLEDRDGRLIPTMVVNDAKDPDSPLHSYFTWDDAEAASQHRLEQARQLIRSVRVEITVHSVPLSVVGYVRDPEVDTNQGGYRNIVALRSEEDSARAVVVDEMKRVSSAVQRAKTIAAVLGVEEDIKQIEAISRSVVERLEMPLV